MAAESVANHAPSAAVAIQKMDSAMGDINAKLFAIEQLTEAMMETFDSDDARAEGLTVAIKALVSECDRIYLDMCNEVFPKRFQSTESTEAIHG